MLSGCDDSRILQKEEVKSPDGRWIARSEIEQIGGPGQAGLLTHVYLLRTETQKPLEILLLNNSSLTIEQAETTANVQMRWRDSDHLDLLHVPEAKVELQVVKSAGVEISLH